MRTRFVLGLLLALTLSGCGAGVSALGRQGVPTISPPSATPAARSVTPPAPAPTWTPDFRPRMYATPAPTATPVTTLPPAAFGFVFTYGACVDRRVDTFAGVFHRDAAGGAPPATVPLALTAADLRRIQQAVDAMGFFGYPAVFRVGSLFGAGGMMHTPSDHYVFQVREGSSQHRVSWDDNIDGIASRAADRLRNLADLIERTAESAPAVAALPPFMPGCA